MDKSRHTFKFGADIRYNVLDNVAAFDSKGTFTFDNLQNYMNNLATVFQQALQTASFTAQAVAELPVRAGRLPRHARDSR